MPSYEHEELKARAVKWLSSRSTARGVRAALEVRIDREYIADVCAFANLVNNFDESLLQHSFNINTIEPPAKPFGPYSFIFECKVSQGDFNSTFAYGSHHGVRRRHPRANWHLCVTGKDIDISSLPRLWGHLVVSGGGLSLQRTPAYCCSQYVDENHLREEIMWKQGNAPIRKLARSIEQKEE